MGEEVTKSPRKADDPSVLHVRLYLRLRFRINCKYCSHIRFQFKISEAECGRLKGYQRVLSKQMPHFFWNVQSTLRRFMSAQLAGILGVHGQGSKRERERERDLDARFRSWHTNRAVKFF